jgi:hypothetical protein
LGPDVFGLMVPVAIGGNLPNLVGVFPKASRKITTGNPGGLTPAANITTDRGLGRGYPWGLTFLV